ncbi:MAG: class I SAM-dependent methyltransferase [Bacteroidota bacterium]
MTTDVGLWDSEKYVFQKYLKPEDKILDLGCGTGRTTFAIYKLGFTNIVGVDLTPEMVAIADELNAHFHTNIAFKIGDATKLDSTNAIYDAVLFSYNGLMTIPNGVNRNKAIGEIYRVLKPSGTFIFTTHDRERGAQHFKFWREEKQKWNMGNQNPALYEYGDIITKSRNESKEIFIHIPNQEEVADLLATNGFKVMETFYRGDKFIEREQVKAISGECRFWVVQRN